MKTYATIHDLLEAVGERADAARELLVAERVAVVKKELDVSISSLSDWGAGMLADLGRICSCLSEFPEAIHLHLGVTDQAEEIPLVVHWLSDVLVLDFAEILRAGSPALFASSLVGNGDRSLDDIDYARTGPARFVAWRTSSAVGKLVCGGKSMKVTSSENDGLGYAVFLAQNLGEMDQFSLEALHEIVSGNSASTA